MGGGGAFWQKIFHEILCVLPALPRIWEYNLMGCFICDIFTPFRCNVTVTSLKSLQRFFRTRDWAGRTNISEVVSEQSNLRCPRLKVFGHFYSILQDYTPNSVVGIHHWQGREGEREVPPYAHSQSIFSARCTS